MLVLTRKTRQTIRINDNITITVLELANGSVKIGVQAPRDVPVIRGEIVDLGDRPNAKKTKKVEPNAKGERGESRPRNRVIAVTQMDGGSVRYQTIRKQGKDVVLGAIEFGEGVS